jgi:hypothetical protein
VASIAMRPNLIQMAYVTTDLNPALDYWVDVAGAGPFYLADYEPEQQVYRGRPTHISFRVAYGYVGSMQIELIQQLTGGDSAYTEGLNSVSIHPAGGVFHHTLFLHDGYDRIYDRYIAAGAARCYDAFVPGVGRFAYLDARRLTGHYVEFVENTQVFEAACTEMHRIHIDWDGKEPRRDFGDILALL